MRQPVQETLFTPIPALPGIGADRARHRGRRPHRLTTSVYTDADGDYVFARMAAGPYQLWAQAVS